VSVVGVGFDIGCGNAAIRTNVRATQFEREDWDYLADEIAATVSFGVGRSNAADDAPVDNPLFASDAWSQLPRAAKPETLLAKARAQLGTVGSGNHYVDVLADENDAVWVGVHFGSRGLGHTIASGFLALSQGKPWGERVKEVEALLDLKTPSGSAEQTNALYSTVHGAGRVMSRTQAAGKTKGWGKKKRIVSPGLISPEMLTKWVVDEKRVILRGGGLDEAPQAYRRLPTVLEAQGDTIEVLHTLKPIVVVMAGADEFDPYKD